MDENIRLKKLKSLEFYVENSTHNEVDIEFDAVRSFNTFSESGIAIRTLENEGHLGFSYSTDLSKNSIEHLIDRSIISSKMTEKIPDNYDFADSYDKPPEVGDIYDANVPDSDENDLVPQIEGVIEGIKSKEIRFDKFILSTKLQNKHLYNSNETDYNYKETFIQVRFLLSSSNSFINRIFAYRKFDLELIRKDINDAAETLKLYNKLPRRVVEQTKTMMIFHPYAFAWILSCILSTVINAEAFLNYDTYLELNKKFVSNNMMLIDDGSLEGGLLSRPVDGEGFPTKKTTIIDKGIFVKPISNNYWANIKNFENTSNSARMNFRSPPYLSVTNLIFDIEDQKADIGEIFNLENTGIYVLNLFPDPTKLNMKTGEYLFNVTEACCIENGEIKAFLKPFLLAGNAKDLLSNIRLCSKESLGNLGVICPYVNVSDMPVIPINHLRQ
ncbi:MAG TPA: TldD/PmbA family protein [Candidatus Methanoperedens sp.]